MRKIFLVLLYFIMFDAHGETPASLPPMHIPLNMHECVQENTKDCRKGVCISQTPENCSSTCYTYAKQKCKALSEQKVFKLK